MKYSFLLSAAAAIASVARGDRYCAIVSGSEALGATGWYNLQIDSDGQGKHSMQLDLSEFTGLPDTCDVTAGLTYHIHSFWDDSTGKLSGANTECGLSATGNHFDPYLACSVNSEESASCTALGRTTTSTPAYTYPCNPSQYAAGRYEYCEVGDTSGKFGKLFPVDNVYSVSVDDPSPALIPSYAADSQLSTQWISLVVHCGTSRIVCAKYLPVDENAACGAFTPTTASTSSGDNDDSDLLDLRNLGAAVLWSFVIIFGFALGLFVGYKILSINGSGNGSESLFKM